MDARTITVCKALPGAARLRCRTSSPPMRTSQSPSVTTAHRMRISATGGSGRAAGKQQTPANASRDGVKADNEEPIILTPEDGKKMASKPAPRSAYRRPRMSDEERRRRRAEAQAELDEMRKKGRVRDLPSGPLSSPSRPPLRVVLVDGYNAIGATRGLSQLVARGGGMQNAREALNRIAEAYGAAKGARVYVVYDAMGSRTGQDRQVRVGPHSAAVFSALSEADSFIGLAAEHWKRQGASEVLVVSNDRYVQQLVTDPDFTVYCVDLASWTAEAEAAARRGGRGGQEGGGGGQWPLMAPLSEPASGQEGWLGEGVGTGTGMGMLVGSGVLAAELEGLVARSVWETEQEGEGYGEREDVEGAWSSAEEGEGVGLMEGAGEEGEAVGWQATAVRPWLVTSSDDEGGSEGPMRGRGGGSAESGVTQQYTQGRGADDAAAGVTPGIPTVPALAAPAASGPPPAPCLVPAAPAPAPAPAGLNSLLGAGGRARLRSIMRQATGEGEGTE